MVKATANKKSKKEKTTKKSTKAKQIIARRAYTPTAIKQKVVVNVTAPTRRRGRPRGSTKNPINKPQSVPTVTQFPLYDPVRASVPYVEEIKSELKALKDSRESNEKNLLGMQQQALMMQMYNQQPQHESYKPIKSTAFIEELDDEEDEDVLNEKIAINQAKLDAEKAAIDFQTKQISKAQQTLLNKQEGARKAREARAKLSQADQHADKTLTKKAFEAMRKATTESKADREAIEAERIRKAEEKAEKERIKAEKKAERERIKAEKEAAKLKAVQEAAAAPKIPQKTPQKTPQSGKKKGKK